MIEPKLTEAECETLHAKHRSRINESWVGCPLCAGYRRAVEAILADRLAAVEAERDAAVANRREFQKRYGMGMQAAEQVVAAWAVSGPQPDYHERWQHRLRTEWPTLARALDNLCAVAHRKE